MKESRKKRGVAAPETQRAQGKASDVRGRGGGRATAGGVTFQSTVGACAAAALLAERPASRLATGLPGSPRRVLFETPAPVDDLTIETDRGAIYVQAKRTISLSSRSESELASVAGQFVRQFRSGIAEGSTQRPLESTRDRLVLAVSDQAGGTIVNDLRDVLDRSRTGAATGLAARLQTALMIFGNHISREWHAAAGQPITEAERDALLSLCSVIVVGDVQRQVAEETLRDIVALPGDEASLFDLLVGWAANAARSGVGGDAAAIRLALMGRARLKEPPSYRDDVARMHSHSANVMRRLERFATIEAPEGRIAISRPVVDVVVDAAKGGSLAITGEPGAGKSAVLHGAAQRLADQAIVVVFTVEASALSLDLLRRDIGLEHPLVDVLAQMSSDKPAYLLLDALDAVRGGAAEATYKKLVELVRELDGWQVVASVRTFDLRLGKDWRRLFAGTPPDAAHANDEAFSAVRHVHISTLDAGEKAQVASKSPSVAAAIAAGGAKMEALASNPFNLALLSDLLRGGAAVSTFASVGTRGELLARYWDERVSHLGTPATVSLRSVVLLMIAARSIDIPETDVPVLTAATVDELQRAGVLVTESTRRLGFRHHVLFDYAVARLALLPDRAEAMRYLSRASGAGLLLSPSLGYWLEDLKKGLPASTFWSFVIDVVTDGSVDPIVRIEVARLATESVKDGEDLAPLAAVLAAGNPSTDRAFQYLAGSLLTKGHLKQPIEVGPWASLLAMVAAPKQAQIGSMTGLVGTLLENGPTPEATNSLGIASRTLFDVMSADEDRIPWLARRVIPFVARTFGTDAAASRQRLDQLFAPERFARFGYIEIPALADEVLHIARHDEELVLRLFVRVFRGGDFSRDQATPMSASWILSLTSNAAQDFQMAGYVLSTAFPELLEKYPRTALRALATALNAAREKEHTPSDPQTARTIQIAGGGRSFEDDYSHAWAWDIDAKDHDDYAKLYRAAMKWIDRVTDDALLRDIPDLILGETTIALAWRAVLDFAARQPAVLGTAIWPTPADPILLSSLDTRRSAIAATTAIHPHLSLAERERAETEWLAREFSEAKRPDKMRREILGTLFDTIGASNLATDAARSFLTECTKDGSTFENRKPFEVHTRWGDASEEHWLAREGVDTRKPETEQLLALSTALRASREALKQNKTDEQEAALWAATLALDDAILASSAMKPLIEQEVLDALAEGLGLSLASDLVPADHLDRAMSRLLSIAEHLHPQSGADTEANFARSQSWGSPSPRVEAAQALASLAGKAELWPLMRERFETMLLGDSHPAVRFQFARVLPWVGRVDRSEMWRLAKAAATNEQNPAILRVLVSRLPANSIEDADELEPVVLELARRLPQEERGGGDPVVRLITFFAINSARTASASELRSWVDNFASNEHRLNRALLCVRDALLLGYDRTDPTLDTIRQRACEFIWSLITAVEPDLRSWSISSREPTPQEVVALKLFNEIADQVYYAVGHDKLTPELEQASARRRFLLEYTPLISKLTRLGTPRSVHHLLEVLSRLIETDPERCFDLVAEAILRTTGVARYEHESLGAALFVQLIGRYLADYRSIFDNQVRRTKLIDCIAVFVEAGWPEARRLFQSLPELLQ